MNFMFIEKYVLNNGIAENPKKEFVKKELDFQDVSHEEDLRFFGYKGVTKIGKNLYQVASAFHLGMELPAIKIQKI